MKDNKKQFHRRNNGDRLKVKPEKKSKKELDPNRPRRPQSPFFIFLDQFRREFNEANPDNKSVSVVGKAAGKKWKKMTEEEKEPFAAIAKSKKAEYAINIQQYNMQLANGTNTATDGTKTIGDDDSDKPNSEVNDEKPKSEVNDEKESGSKEEKDDKEVGP